MRNYIIKLVILLIFFQFIYGWSQSEAGSNNENVNINTPLSPNSAAFEKYGNVPVNLISGTLTPSIPIYDIPVGKYKFSVQFNYSSQGLRVDEHPTNIGMGWSLNLGSITRTVKDLPDDSSTLLYNVDQPIIGDDNYWIGSSIAETLTLDSERDVFTVNVDGINTKFLIINNEIIKITLDNIDIQGGGGYYIVTSTDGTKYHFGEGNAFEKTKARRSFGQFLPPTFYETSYLLTHIDYPDGNILNISYSKSLAIFKDNLSQTGEIRFGLQDNKHSTLPTINNKGVNSIDITSEIATPVRIETGDISLDFTTTNFNEYISGFPAIDYIDLNYKNVRKRRVQLNYNHYNSIAIGTNTLSKSVKRPFLDTIEFKDSFLNNINQYNFDYYKPDQMPHRLSFSQDILGYFNGVNNNNFIFNSLKDFDYLPDFRKVKNDKQEFNDFLYNFSGDRKPNKNFAENGLLKKITYPTKGFTEFEYEGNLTDIPVIIYPPFVEQDSHYIPAIGDTQTIIKDTVFNSALTQRLYLVRFNKSFTTMEGCNPELDNTHPTYGKFSIYDDNNQIMNIHQIKPTGIHINTETGVNLDVGTTEYEQNNSPIASYYELEAGKQYNIKHTAYKCYDSKMTFKYRDSLPYPSAYFVEAGGLRIKSVKNFDFNTTILNEKKYQYSVGKYAVDKPLSTLNKKIITVKILGYMAGIPVEVDRKDVTLFALSSNTRFPLRNLSGEFYVYDKVEEIESSGNFTKGKIIREFSSPNVFLPFDVQNYETASSNISSETYYSNELVTTYYNHQNSIVRVDSINYKRNPVNIKFFDYTALSTLENKCSNNDGSQNTLFDCPIEVGLQHLNDERWWSIMKSYTTQYWNSLESKKTTEFLNGKPLATTTEYFYNNPLHYQPTVQKITFPDNSIQENNYKYAYEKANANLIAANMVGIPLETEIKKNGKTISKSGIDYTTKVFGGIQLILPDVSYSYDLQNSSTLATEVKYNEYDDKGNILQYTLKPDSNGSGGIPVAIIWGYNQTQPIAKIEGATYVQVAGFAAAIVAESNSDAGQATNNDETTLLSALDTFRQNLPNYHVSTYSYDPLVGVRTITPPSGIREYYFYDTANRLQSVKDSNGNILKEYKYNYKP